MPQKSWTIFSFIFHCGGGWGGGVGRETIVFLFKPNTLSHGTAKNQQENSFRTFLNRNPFSKYLFQPHTFIFPTLLSELLLRSISHYFFTLLM